MQVCCLSVTNLANLIAIVNNFYFLKQYYVIDLFLDFNPIPKKGFKLLIPLGPVRKASLFSCDQ